MFRKNYLRRRGLKGLIILFSIVVFVLAESNNTTEKAYAKIHSYNPSSVIAAINNYRVQNGLPPYQVNSILMGIAQGQSVYQASISTVTHVGPGGSRPIDRAYAAGYGNGGTVFVSEIIYGGNNASAETAISWWKTSNIHNSTMLSSNYSEIGAGVAYNGSYAYYTAVAGYVTGGSLSPTQTAVIGGNPTQTPYFSVPVVTATQREDGSIVHIVRTGQALWNIAAIYGVSVETLREINGLQENSFLHVDDVIIIKPAYTTTPTITQTNVPQTTISSTPERTPTKDKTTATVEEDLPTHQLPSRTPTTLVNETGEIEETFKNPAVRWVVILAFGSIIAVLISSLFVRQKPS
jgi:uncharacterized protein YkwD